jgi:hypothetical protein
MNKLTHRAFLSRIHGLETANYLAGDRFDGYQIGGGGRCMQRWLIPYNLDNSLGTCQVFIGIIQDL